MAAEKPGKSEIENLIAETFNTEKTFLDAMIRFTTHVENFLRDSLELDPKTRNRIETFLEPYQMLAQSGRDFNQKYPSTDAGKIEGQDMSSLIDFLDKLHMRPMLTATIEYQEFSNFLLKCDPFQAYSQAKQFNYTDSMSPAIQRPPRYMMLVHTLREKLNKQNRNDPRNRNTGTGEILTFFFEQIKEQVKAMNNIAMSILGTELLKEQIQEKRAEIEYIGDGIISTGMMLAVLYEYRINHKLKMKNEWVDKGRLLVEAMEKKQKSGSQENDLSISKLKEEIKDLKRKLKDTEEFDKEFKEIRNGRDFSGLLWELREGKKFPEITEFMRIKRTTFEREYAPLISPENAEIQAWVQKMVQAARDFPKFKAPIHHLIKQFNKEEEKEEETASFEDKAQQLLSTPGLSEDIRTLTLKGWELRVASQAQNPANAANVAASIEALEKAQLRSVKLQGRRSAALPPNHQPGRSADLGPTQSPKQGNAPRSPQVLASSSERKEEEEAVVPVRRGRNRAVFCAAPPKQKRRDSAQSSLSTLSHSDSPQSSLNLSPLSNGDNTQSPLSGLSNSNSSRTPSHGAGPLVWDEQQRARNQQQQEPVNAAAVQEDFSSEVLSADL